MKNKAIRNYGTIGGLLLSILFLGPIAISPNSYRDPAMMGIGEVVGYGVMILAMCCVFFGVRSAKKNSEKAFGFGKALSTGLLITLVANLIFYMANVLLYEVIAPDFLENFMAFYKDYTLEQTPMEKREVVLAQFEQEAEMMTNGWVYGMIMAATSFAFGLVFSLLAAVIFGRKKHESQVSEA